jgi:hypothetical protein
MLRGRSSVSLLSSFNGTQVSKFSSYKRQRGRGAPDVPPVELPEFAGLLRQFYKQSHPDLLKASHSDHSVTNDQSWQTLNGILSTIKECNSYPPRMVKTIPFYMRSKESPTGVKHVELTIRTGGGDCKKQLTVTFQEFYKKSGISADGKFVWGKDYFPIETTNSGVKEVVEEY